MNYDWNFGRLAPYLDAFLAGVSTTVCLSVLVIIIGTTLGVVLGFLASRRSLRIILYVLFDVVRAIPPLVLLLFFYFLLVPQVVGFSATSFWVAVIALSLNLAVFTADVVRSSIEGVPRDDIDAAKALGFDDAMVRRYIVLPHVFRTALPAMVVLFIGMVKISSLASVINVREIVYAAQTVVAEISRSLEAWLIVAGVYIALVVPATIIARRIEAWSRRGAPVESNG